MFNKMEMILTIALCIISILLILSISLRLFNLINRKKRRIPIWRNEVSVQIKITKIVYVLSLILVFPCIIYYLYVVFLGFSVVRDYARYLFLFSFGLWTVFEIYRCFSISEKLNKGGSFRKIMFGLPAIIALALSCYLFPVFLKTYPFPPEEECVVLELPFNGTWLAGHAGGSLATNPHSKNRFAIDFLKLGPDNRFYKEKEELVTDFYSYNEPVFSPADAIVSQVVDSLESDLMSEPDTVNIGGNFVILNIGDGKYVYFGHFKKATIALKAGDCVTVGTYIGSVGNSGNSSFPHLHMHVQNIPSSDPENRITFPFRFKEIQRMRIAFWKRVEYGYLLRNDRVKK